MVPHLGHTELMVVVVRAGGVGVLFVESKRALDSLVQLIYKQNKDADVLIQEYIKTDGDVRVVIAGSDIIGTMKREVVEGDFRSNYTQGAGVKSYKLSDEEIRQCMIAAKAVDGDFVAVDTTGSNGEGTLDKSNNVKLNNAVIPSLVKLFDK